MTFRVLLTLFSGLMLLLLFASFHLCTGCDVLALRLPCRAVCGRAYTLHCMAQGPEIVDSVTIYWAEA
jgi:hypothetical protein